MNKLLIIIIAVLAAGCSASVRPVLYPNAHLSKVGQDQAQQDIAECCEMAEAYVKSEPGQEVVKDAAKAGAIGAAAGAATGAVWGHAGQCGARHFPDERPKPGFQELCRSLSQGERLRAHRLGVASPHAPCMRGLLL